MPHKNLEPRVDVVVRLDAELINAELVIENRRQRKAMCRALAIAKDSESGFEHADLVSIWKILESALPIPEPPAAQEE